ncbi:MAG: hypothetical protein ABR585_00920 [Gemmatimonadaceae bacterium]
MRYVVASLMGVGGILASFGGVIFVLELLAHHADSGRGLRDMSVMAIGSVVLGGGLFALGFLLNRLRLGRRASPELRAGTPS